MKNLVFETSENWGATILRVVLGLILFSHGAGALLGWFGGHGFVATMQGLHDYYALPKLIAAFVICVQFFGSIMLMTGTATRLAALGIFGMLIGMASTHINNGLHMNWSGANAGEGYEYHLLAMAMSLVLLLFGGGAYSIDRNFISK